MEIDYLNYDFATWAKRVEELLKVGKRGVATVNCPACWKPVAVPNIKGCCHCEEKIAMRQNEVLIAHGLEAATTETSYQHIFDHADHA